MDLWGDAMAVYDEAGDVVAGIIVRFNKRQPVANLQLLHTFSEHRRKGLGKFLTENQFARAFYDERITHFRVSAEEDAVPFYQSVGFKFWGAQKSGSQLSIFKIGGPMVRDGIYDSEDKIIQSAVFSTRRGGVVTHFREPK